MKTTRRQFIKSLLATAVTAAIAPQVLVESVHGASDLTAHERDVAAEVMGLRSKQWRGYSPSSPSPWSARVVNAKEGEIVVSYEPDDAVHYGTEWITPYPKTFQVPVLVPGEQAVHVKFTESETVFGYVAYPVLGTDIAGNTGYGQITLPKDTPEEEVRAELEGAARRMFNAPFRAFWRDNMYDSEPKII